MKSKFFYIILVFFVLLVLLVLGVVFLKPVHKIEEPNLKKSTFTELPGWNNADATASFHTFQVSCKTFLRQNPESSVGSKYIDIKVKDWHPACKAALTAFPKSDQEARAFFEAWFTPVIFHDGKPIRGLFTGYFLPILKGSLTQTDEFSVPIYGAPNDMITVNLGQFDKALTYNRKIVGRLKGGKLIPYYTRKEINKGAIEKVAPVIAWINSKVDRQFLEIEGSGVIQLQDGTDVYVGYNGQNGAAYTPIARVLIHMGVMTKDNASMQGIRTFFKKNPDQVETVLNQNKSFVFFTILSQKAALGSQGVPLTPGYSLAVDRKWVPLGVPIWLNTTRPSQNVDKHKPFNRLMIAQDTGGAIRGPVRGDVYWGAGEQATRIAGHMKNSGYYWLLLPQHIIPKILA